MVLYQMTMNEYNQYIINEDDAIQTLLSDIKIKNIITEDTEWVDKFNSNSNLFDFGYIINAETPATNEPEYIKECLNEWYMPKEYIDLDLETFLLSKCNTEFEKNRVKYELELYTERNLLTLLKFLCYFIDVTRENNIILGVGRGSSVASYILYLIGIHKVNSIEYDLDIKEFLK